MGYPRDAVASLRFLALGLGFGGCRALGFRRLGCCNRPFLHVVFSLWGSSRLSGRTLQGLARQNLGPLKW